MSDNLEDLSHHVLDDDDDERAGASDPEDESTHLFTRAIPSVAGFSTPQTALALLPTGIPERIAGDSSSQSELAGWRALLEGDVIARRYRVGERSQRTGRIISVSARHLELDQAVTLTYLAEEALSDAAAVSEFLRRARLVARVPSGRTARVMDVGRLVFGSPFAVLEQLRGWTFAEILRVRGRLPLNEAVDYVSQACRAIADAEAVGLSRMGANMSNLVLTRESNGAPVVRTILFGAEAAEREEIVRAGFSTDVDFDEESLLPYLAPEEIRDPEGPHAGRSDVWALGAVLYELYTGARAFSSSTAAGLLARIVADVPLDVRALRPESPSDVRAVIGRCLAKDPGDRHRDVRELAEDLSHLAHFAVGVAPTAALVTRASIRPPELSSIVPTARTVVTARESRGWAVDLGVPLVAGVALGVLGLAGFQATRSDGPETSYDARRVAAAMGPSRSEESHRDERPPSLPPSAEEWQSEAPATARLQGVPTASVPLSGRGADTSQRAPAGPPDHPQPKVFH